MGAKSAFYDGNYPCQPIAASLFLNSVDLSVLREVESDASKDVSFPKIPESFTTVEVLIEHTFFAVSPFIYLLVGREGCSLFLLEMLVD